MLNIIRYNGNSVGYKMAWCFSCEHDNQSCLCFQYRPKYFEIGADLLVGYKKYSQYAINIAKMAIPDPETVGEVKKDRHFVIKFDENKIS